MPVRWIDRSRKGDFGVTRDRLMALKGDRLKPRGPAAVADDRRPASQMLQATPSGRRPWRESDGRHRPIFARECRGCRRGHAERLGGTSPAIPCSPRRSATRGRHERRERPSHEAPPQSVSGLAFAAADAVSSVGAEQLYFNIDPMGKKLGAIEPWAPGEEPRFEDTDVAASNSANVKLAAVPPVPSPPASPEASSTRRSSGRICRRCRPIRAW